MDKKKVISIGIVALTIVVVFVIAACIGGNDDVELEVSTTTTVNTTNNIILGYSAEVTEKSLKVYKDDIFVQELTYPEDNKAEFILDFAQKHISFIDMNFDGNDDICLTISTSEDGFNYYCWIFDTAKGEFQYNNSLSELSSISLDNENKQIVSTEKNQKGETVYVIYGWENGKLKKIETKSDLPETVTDKVLGSTSSNATTARPSTSDNQTNDIIEGVFIPNVTKPSGSSSSGGGIVIATENKNDVWY